MSEPIHIMRPSPARRGMALVIQSVLGLLLLYLALAHPPDGVFWRAFLLVMGVLALAMGLRGWRSAAQGIVFDDTGLRSEDGTVIADLDNIASVDRGTFAFKPSNGFLIRLQAPMPRAWAPGMWWRVGRRVGIGGVISGADAKFVADALSMKVSQR